MKYIITILLVLSFAGCSTVMHANELLALKSVADDETALAKRVKSEDANFEKILKQYEVDQLTGYTSKKQFVKDFGQPVFKRPFDKDAALEEWLYRYSTQFFNSPKIYVYFDATDKKTDLHYEPGKETNPQPNLSTPL